MQEQLNVGNAVVYIEGEEESIDPQYMEDVHNWLDERMNLLEEDDA